MKPQIKRASPAILVITIVTQLSTAFGQGSLTPAGAPAPTMKTLDQIEPHVPIASAPFTISQPGSYYLTGNLSVSVGDAITIATENVFLDLNGFTITSTYAGSEGSGSGIVTSPDGFVTPRNIEICNGFIKGPVTYTSAGGYVLNGGFRNGIYALATATFNIRVHDVSVSGCRESGIALDGFKNSTIERCTARIGLITGLGATVIRDSVASQFGSVGVSGITVENCRGDGAGNGYGVSANESVVNSYGTSSLGPAVFSHAVVGCMGLAQGGSGISGYNVDNSYATSNTGIGVDAKTVIGSYAGSVSNIGVNADSVVSCYGVSSTNLGIKTHVATNSYALSDSAIALSADSTLNCYAKSNTGQYALTAITAQNSYGDTQGLNATNATNCYGSGGLNGLVALVATNCYGTASTGAGLRVTWLATNCGGTSAGGGAGISSQNIVFGCYGTSANGTGLSAVTATSSAGSGTPNVSVTHPHEMP